MGNGYWSKLLRVNLSENSVNEVPLSEERLRKLLGGIGLAVDTLYKEVGSEVDPLDPRNEIIFSVGPLQGTNITGSGKWIVASKSPLTGILGFGAAGGDWGVNLKKAGYETLIVQGKAKTPSYLWIDNDQVKIKDASQMWGRDSYEATELVKQDLNQHEASIATIGQAGEKTVSIANIVVDNHSFAGRCGLGAVMGSKNLKGIAVRGTKEVDVSHPDRVKELVKNLAKKVAENASGMRDLGTAGEIPKVNKQGDWPIKYWSRDHWEEGAKKLSGTRYDEKLTKKSVPCANCVIACHRDVEVKEPEKYAISGAGPEYEALGMLGSNNLVSNLKAIAKANDLCNRYGLDVISTGAFIGFAIECYEKGLLTKEDTGRELDWGDSDMVIDLVKQIGERKGLGELFSDGILDAAESIGSEAEDIAMHVKGLDFPAHDPRAFFGWAISYATGPRGACHTHGLAGYAPQGLLLPEMGIDEEPDRHEMKGSEKIAAIYQDLSALDDSFVTCNFQHFGGFSLTDMLDSLNAITGWGLDINELITIGRRISTLKRLVNVEYGINRENDKLPQRTFKPAKEAPLDAEPWGGRVGQIPEPFNQTLERYYEFRGWDEDGIPTKKSLKRLELE